MRVPSACLPELQESNQAERSSPILNINDLHQAPQETPTCRSHIQTCCWCPANCVFREVLLGITGKDFTLIAASKAAMRGATILKASDDKTRQLNKHTLMAFSGEAGDTGW